MEIAHFVDARRPRWSELEQLLDKAEGTGLSSLALQEARQLSRLYRAASSDLLQVRAQGGAQEVTEYLNDLVGRAYALNCDGQRTFSAHEFVNRGRYRLRARFAAPDRARNPWSGWREFTIPAGP